MTGPRSPGTPTVFGFAAALQRGTSWLPEKSAELARGFRCRTGLTPDLLQDRRRHGVDAAAVLNRHFAAADARPEDLLDAFHRVHVPIHHNAHITAAALRADRERVRETGRWLVRHSVHDCSATVRLALLATDHRDDDVPLIETIGMLAGQYGPLAVYALSRRRGGADAMLRLADRAHDWGRVHLVEALCRNPSPAARYWLLRHACDGDYLNGYFAGDLAVGAHLHEAVTAADIDEPLLEHTGRLLHAMAGTGVGQSFADYPPMAAVLLAYTRHLGRHAPNRRRCLDAAGIADHLLTRAPGVLGWTPEQHDRLIRRFRALLARRDWQAVIRDQLEPHRARHVARVLDTLRARVRGVVEISAG